MRPSRQAWVTTVFQSLPPAGIAMEICDRVREGQGSEEAIRNSLNYIVNDAERSNPVRKTRSFHEEGNLCQLQVKRFFENVES